MSLLEAVSPTARELLKTANEPILAPEIDRTALRILQIVETQYTYLKGKPAHVLAELQHRCKEAMSNDNSAVRLAAQINHDICLVIQEDAKGAKR